MGFCNLCKGTMPDEELLVHLRDEHPSEYGLGPDTWPDGEVVIIDMTLEPDDFTIERGRE